MSKKQINTEKNSRKVEVTIIKMAKTTNSIKTQHAHRQQHLCHNNNHQMTKAK